MDNLNSQKDITVIGAAIIDVLAGPVDEQELRTGSQNVQEMKLSFGGDALNEAVALARMGKKVELVSKLGDDEAGERVLAYIKRNGVSADCIKREPGLITGMNIVLTDAAGERYFLTHPYGSLRTLREDDITPYIDSAADIVSFASMFVSPPLDIPAMKRVFQRIKSKPDRVLAADMTKAKHGETLTDLSAVLPFVDYILPNEDEAARLTGERDPRVNAERFISQGAKCVIIKLGRRGCLIHAQNDLYEIPACPVTHTVDTTGAGDCFAAGFLWALSEGFPLEECGKFACATASCTVEETGATTGLHSLDIPFKRYQEFYHS